MPYGFHGQTTYGGVFNKGPAIAGLIILYRTIGA